MKKFTAGLITGLLIGLLSFTTFAVAEEQIKLIVNGVDITYKSDASPQIINNRTFIPARALAEALGATVGWDDVNKAVIVTSNNNSADLSTVNNVAEPQKENNKIEVLKDYYIKGDVPCIRYNNSVYVPLLDGMNYYKIQGTDVNYDAKTKTVTFNKYGKSFIAGTLENNDDVAENHGRIIIKESILKLFSGGVVTPTEHVN